MCVMMRVMMCVLRAESIFNLATLPHKRIIHLGQVIKSLNRLFDMQVYQGQRTRRPGWVLPNPTAAVQGPVALFQQ